MSQDEDSVTMTKRFDERSRASIAEMLHVMGQSLDSLKGCEFLSSAQQQHVDAAGRHIGAAVEEWIESVVSEPRSPASSDMASPMQDSPEYPERALDHVTEMLAIYHDQVNESDFTPMQLQRVMIAMHNLAAVARELMTSVH